MAPSEQTKGRPAARPVTFDPDPVRATVGRLGRTGERQTMNRVLVTVASKYGATREIGDAVAGVLSARGLDVTVVPPEEIRDVTRFDAIVLGSAVYAGRWRRTAREFVERFGPELADRPLWLFSSGPIGDPPEPHTDPLDATLLMQSTSARGHRLFAGRLELSLLGFADRAVVAALKSPYGDYRDWEAIKGWAEEIATALIDQLSSVT